MADAIVVWEKTHDDLKLKLYQSYGYVEVNKITLRS
jgi:hypothetical protein